MFFSVVQNRVIQRILLVSKSLPVGRLNLVNSLYSAAVYKVNALPGAWSDAWESGKYPLSPSGRRSSSYSTGQAAAYPAPDSWHRRGTSPAGPLPAEVPERGSSPRSFPAVYGSTAVPLRPS